MTRRFACLGLLLLVASCQRKTQSPAPSPAKETKAEHRGSGEHRNALPLKVVVNGKPSVWSPEQIAATPTVKASNRNGETRDVWSVKALVEKNLGPKARVTAVVADGGERVEVSPLDWQSSTRTLILLVSNHGNYKLHAIDASGTFGEALLRGVSGLDVAK